MVDVSNINIRINQIKLVLKEDLNGCVGSKLNSNIIQLADLF